MLVRRRSLDARLPRLPRLARLARRVVAIALAYAVAAYARGPVPTAPELVGVVALRVVSSDWRAPPAASGDRIEPLEPAATQARAGAPGSQGARGMPPAMLAAAPPVVASAVELGRIALPSAPAPDDGSAPTQPRARGPPPAQARRDHLATRG